MAILWNPGGHSIIKKKNMTIGYVKELEYIEKKPQTDQWKNIREVSEITKDKLSPMTEQSAPTFHHNFYPEPMIDLKILKSQEKCEIDYRY